MCEIFLLFQHLFFNRKKNSGFIANCVQTIYRSLDSSERRRPRVKKAEKSAEASTSQDKSDVNIFSLFIISSTLIFIRMLQCMN